MKRGQEYAGIRHPDLLLMLAGDDECIANLSRLEFWSMTMEPTHAVAISKLKNLALT